MYIELLCKGQTLTVSGPKRIFARPEVEIVP